MTMANCSSGGCGSCGNCGSCGGCAKELVLTQPEIHMLQALGQFSFLPVARKADDMTPIYLEDSHYSREEYSLVLQVLEKKDLISIDYDQPLPGADMSGYQGYPVRGSFALTARGQAALEMLEIQGIQSE
jgi:hypothetical protein